MKSSKYEYIKDLLFVVGFTAFVYGLWYLWGVGVAAIVGGIILMLLCLPVKEPSETYQGRERLTSVPVPPPRK